MDNDNTQLRWNYYTLLVFGPILILTGVLGLLGPSPFDLMSTARPYDIFHIVFGSLGTALVLLKQRKAVRAFNIAFGVFDLYQAVAHFAHLYPEQYFQWHRGDDVVHIVIGLALVVIGALGL